MRREDTTRQATLFYGAAEETGNTTIIILYIPLIKYGGGGRLFFLRLPKHLPFMVGEIRREQRGFVFFLNGGSNILHVHQDSSSLPNVPSVR